MVWRLAKGLEQLRKQVNAKWPDRATSSDGTVGDLRHQALPSDHNPDTRGIVHAIDFTHDPKNGFDSYKFADMLLAKQDPRLKYVISNRRIGSGPAGPSPGKWRPYAGTNAHDKHNHISIMVAGEDDPRPWDFGNVVMKPQPEAEPVPRLLYFGMEGDDVMILQEHLGLAHNGYFGYGTAEAVVKVQLEAGLAAHGIVGPGTWKVIKEKMK